jgi:hypothetical protein
MPSTGKVERMVNSRDPIAGGSFLLKEAGAISAVFGARSSRSHKPSTSFSMRESSSYLGRSGSDRGSTRRNSGISKAALRGASRHSCAPWVVLGLSPV